MNNLVPLSVELPRDPTPISVGTSGPDAPSENLFSRAFESLRETMDVAEERSTDAMVGGGQLHTAMIAMSRADLSFRFTAQVRNKVVEAYREMMNLQF
jgi:flagellar hook-basal body complex protein FliE